MFSSIGTVIEISTVKDIVKAILVTAKGKQKPRWLEKMYDQLDFQVLPFLCASQASPGQYIKSSGM